MPRYRLSKLFASLLAVSLAAAPLSADPPATVPAQSDAAGDETAPQKKFPTPAELIRQMKEQKAQEEAQTLVAQIDFSMPLSEQAAPLRWFGAPGLDRRRA